MGVVVGRYIDILTITSKRYSIELADSAARGIVAS